MLTTVVSPDVRSPGSIDDAVRQLTDLGADAMPLAGGTWIMRAGLRGETPRRCYVSLDRIAELRRYSVGDVVELGAQLTHRDLTSITTGPAATALRQAAALSAFPQVRNVATLAGNIAATGFAAADLVPALLAGQAEVELAGPEGPHRTTLASYLTSRDQRPSGELITAVRLPAPPGRFSAFERLTVRVGGEYAVANVAVSVDVDAGGSVHDARIAVGAVEPVATLGPARALIGHPVGDDDAAQAAGEAVAAGLTPREDPDAPGWYRVAVVPTLVRRAVAQLPQLIDH
ncbi:FAD binding domain-containing protein [Phytoactinopolyspora limicola]|uniref:FAD binding domain-containing protein n=1 Tax=Phytoactinopolyspora limicola TaxID=2715536 RepID=UPI00140A4EB1|nr:FAD binding domain-containing protein [Phytoactinopolyspora limicola]